MASFSRLLDLLGLVEEEEGVVVSRDSARSASAK
jgi:hypothetical protein